MPFSKLGYISFPNRDIIFSLSPLQVTSSGGVCFLYNFKLKPIVQQSHYNLCKCVMLFYYITS